MLEDRQITIKQLSRIYEVSETAVYKWVRKCSSVLGLGEKIVVEKESEGARTLALMKKVAELERVVGQKQLEIDYLKKMVEEIEDEHHREDRDGRHDWHQNVRHGRDD